MTTQPVKTASLEMRWRTNAKTDQERKSLQEGRDYSFGETYFCDYGLSLPVDELDIRSNEGDQYGVKTEIFITFSTTLMRGNAPSPGYTPFRDGVHARRDSEKLNGLPIYVVDLDGTRHLITE